ncbi:NAD(P)-dependent oxidoreductase, partial [Actinomadura kijaniata]|uniref:NAD(P)-dependent oxidoreductase n=1 Tax=Actinomadura kijaniata TaxID=46161 RepID=UPI003F19473A
PEHPRLTTATADLGTPGSLRGLLDDQDAVISTLGAAGRGPTTVYSAGTTEIIAAMRPGRRLIVISSAGLGTPADAGPGTRLAARLLHQIMRHTYTDMARMERLLADSDLDWTAVRP